MNTERTATQQAERDAAKRHADEAACRQAYDNRYHKIRAAVGYDEFRAIWFKALESHEVYEAELQRLADIGRLIDEDGITYPPPDAVAMRVAIGAGLSRSDAEALVTRVMQHVDHGRAAVEADRQSNDTMLAHEWIRPALNLPNYAPYRFDYYAQKIEELMAERQNHLADVRKMVPSNDELLALSAECEKMPGGLGMHYANYGRALLSRYSSSQPAEGQEVSIDISTGDHDAGRRAFGKLTGEVNPSAHGDVWLAEGYINEPAEDRSLGIATLKDVDAMIHILEKGKWGAEHVGKTPMSRRLEAAITKRLHGQPAASAEPRPDEYVYFADWYGKAAPDESEVKPHDMARHAWLAGIRFADLFPHAAPVAQEPSQAIFALGAIASFAGTRTLKTIQQIRAYAKHNADSCSPPVAQEQSAVNQPLTTDQALADTQRQIIEAAEQRGYARAMSERGRDHEDAERYQWLFGARTSDEVRDQNVGLANSLPQDLVLCHLSSTFCSKEDADAMIDAARAAR